MLKRVLEFLGRLAHKRRVERLARTFAVPNPSARRESFNPDRWIGRKY